MKKRFIAIAGAAALTISMSVTALTAPPASYGNGFCGGGYSLMRDANGDFLDQDAFEANLDKAIEDGYIQEDDREFFVDRYEYCLTYGNGAMGGCGNRGRGCGMYYNSSSN